MKLALPSRFRGGFALIIVMLAIFVLATMAAMLAFSMKVETKLASTANNDQDMIWMARSGVELARWTLVQEASIPSEPYDSLNQIWAGGAGTAGESNSPVNGVPLTDYPIGNGSVSIKIIDLERYANINTATTPLLQQALTVMGVDADDMSVISDSIQDWVQPGDSPRIAGAKNDYYQSLDPPYNCKEAPIDDMSELLLVHGISEHPEIYWGGDRLQRSPLALPTPLGHRQFAGRTGGLSVWVEGRVHPVFHRANQCQHGGCERLAINSRGGHQLCGQYFAVPRGAGWGRNGV